MNSFELEGDVLEPGVLIQCTTANGGGSATFRIIRHRGAIVHDAPSGLRKLFFAEMSMLRGAIYTERVITNGWEPHQQPAPCAYLPLTWSDLQLAGRSNGRRMYLAREATSGRMTLFITPDVPQELTFVATETSELDGVARDLATATGADAIAILNLLSAGLLVQPKQVTPAAA
jgi:hypothetical protein